MKTLRALLPLGLALAGAAALIWLLLSRDSGLGRWILALFLAAHGLVHVFFRVPRPHDAGDDWPFDLADAWPVSLGAPVGVARTVALALVAIVVLGYLAAALATIGVLLPPEWWRILVLVPTGASVLLLALACRPMLLLGFAIDAALFWLALSSGWVPAA